MRSGERGKRVEAAVVGGCARPNSLSREDQGTRESARGKGGWGLENGEGGEGEDGL